MTAWMSNWDRAGRLWAAQKQLPDLIKQMKKKRIREGEKMGNKIFFCR